MTEHPVNPVTGRPRRRRSASVRRWAGSSWRGRVSGRGSASSPSGSSGARSAARSTAGSSPCWGCCCCRGRRSPTRSCGAPGRTGLRRWSGSSSPPRSWSTSGRTRSRATSGARGAAAGASRRRVRGSTSSTRRPRPVVVGVVVGVVGVRVVVGVDRVTVTSPVTVDDGAVVVTVLPSTAVVVCVTPTDSRGRRVRALALVVAGDDARDEHAEHDHAEADGDHGPALRATAGALRAEPEPEPGRAGAASAPGRSRRAGRALRDGSGGWPAGAAGCSDMAGLSGRADVVGVPHRAGHAAAHHPGSGDADAGGAGVRGSRLRNGLVATGCPPRSRSPRAGCVRPRALDRPRGLRRRPGASSSSSRRSAGGGVQGRAEDGDGPTRRPPRRRRVARLTARGRQLAVLTFRGSTAPSRPSRARAVAAATRLDAGRRLRRGPSPRPHRPARHAGSARPSTSPT